MECKYVEKESLEGQKGSAIVCENAELPPELKGFKTTLPDDIDLIVIGSDLDDLRRIGISYPKLYVSIHEWNHKFHPEESEYKIREMSDKEYEKVTGESIDTTAYFSTKGCSNYENYANRVDRGFD